MRKKIILAAAISAALSVSAFAATTGNTAPTGVVIGGTLGVAQVSGAKSISYLGKLPASDMNGVRSLDTKKVTHTQDMNADFHLAWGLFAGYQYAIMHNIAIGAQLGYNDNGFSKTKDVNLIGQTLNGKIDSSDIDLLATAGYYFNNGVNLFAKAGVARVKEIESFNDTTNNTSFQGSPHVGYAPETVIGVGYMPVKNVNITLAWDHIYGKDKATNFDTATNKVLSASGVASVNAVKAGVTYTLPM